MSVEEKEVSASARRIIVPKKGGKQVSCRPYKRDNKPFLPLPQQENVANYFLHKIFKGQDKGMLLYWKLGSGKCVLPGTQVYVNNSIENIENIWDKYKSYLIFQDENLGEWTEPNEEIKVNSFDDKTGQIKVGRVKNLYRQPIKENVIKVELDNGESITITKAHKLYTEKGWSNELKNCKYVCLPKRVPKMNVTNTGISMALSKFLAWQLAEGHERYTHKNSAQLIITQKDVSILNDIMVLYETLSQEICGEKKSCYLRFPKKRCPYVEFNCNWYVKYLEKFNYKWGNKSATKSIPNILLQAEDDKIRAFLSIYFDAEAHVENNKSLEIPTASSQIIRQLEYLLRRFGIWLRWKKRLKWATNGKKIKREYYIGHLTSIGLRIFQEEIGFNILYKKEALQKLCQRKTNSNVEILPINLEMKTIWETSNIPQRKLGGSHYIQGKELYTYQKLHKIIQDVDALPQPYITKRNHITKQTFQEVKKSLNYLYNRELNFSKILNVTEEEYEGWVYDLEVEEYHNYMANGMICHNTCTSIIIADMIRQALTKPDLKKYKVYFVSPGSLRSNFIQEYCKLCGEYPKSFKKRFRFFSYNYSQVHKQLAERWDNALIIVDEAHGLINGVRNGSVNMIALYNQIITSQNSKVLLLSGTPLVSWPYELGLIMHIIRPGIMPYTEEKFSELVEVMENGEILVKNPISLMKKMQGVVSYVKGKEYDEFFPEVINAPPIMVQMTPHQLKYYALRRAEEERVFKPSEEMRQHNPARYKKLRNKWFLAYSMIRSRQVSNFSYPSNIQSKLNLSRAARKKLQPPIPEDEPENEGGWVTKDELSNLKKLYSPKFYEILLRIFTLSGKHMVFSFFKSRYGVYLIAAFLKCCGLDPLIYSGDISSDTARINLLKKFNSPENATGDIHKVILLTQAGSQGITLKDVQYVHIVEPDINETEIKQVIGRAVRHKSHMNLPPEKRKVTIFRYLSTLSEPLDENIVFNVKGGKGNQPSKIVVEIRDQESADVIVFNRGMRKLKGIEYIDTLVKRSSYDCKEPYSYQKDCFAVEQHLEELEVEEFEQDIFASIAQI